MKNLIVDKNISIIKAMKKLNESGQKCLIILENENLLMGTLTDGDIRKAILNGANISNSIDLIYNRKPTFLVEGDFSLETVKKIFLESKFDLIPVIDKEGKHVDTLFWEKIFKKNRN